jgi:hypothetical protein
MKTILQEGPLFKGKSTFVRLTKNADRTMLQGCGAADGALRFICCPNIENMLAAHSYK